MELCLEMCIFLGYPKGMRGSFFYSPKDNKVFNRTNTIFLEKDYIKNYKPKGEAIIGKKITREQSTPSVLNFETLGVN